MKAEGYPAEISSALVGSCTNSSYEDIGRAAHVARQASARGLRVKTPLLITPGSEQVRATIERDGLLADLEAIGATVLANACGPCIGQWQRDDIVKGETNTIVTSFNRNFPARNDGNAATLSFIGSPETVIAMALTGRLDVDFVHEPVVGRGRHRGAARGAERRRAAGDGLRPGRVGVRRARRPIPTRSQIVVSPDSERLQLLEPFPAWDGKDFTGPAGAAEGGGQVHDRSHLARRSVAALPRSPREHLRQPVHRREQRVRARRARPRRRRARRLDREAARSREGVQGRRASQWVAIGDENYGEGSSREHAAMEPRFMGGRAVIVRSFARIHEANLKKQGVLPLTFAEPARLRKSARRRQSGHRRSLPRSRRAVPVKVVLHHVDGRRDEIETTHTMSEEHIEWFNAGSALNLLAAQQR